jgi:hypothetical protein
MLLAKRLSVEVVPAILSIFVDAAEVFQQLVQLPISFCWGRIGTNAETIPSAIFDANKYGIAHYSSLLEKEKPG